MRMVDQTGRRVGRLTAIRVAGKTKNGAFKWECKCDCGNTIIVHSVSLKHDNPNRSCGCYTKERVTQMNYKHGGRFTKTYNVWASMRKRCNNPTHKSYMDYGGRGITVCQEWEDYEKFLEDMGEAPEGFSLDRKDNNQGYSKDNCKWSTMKEQGNNKRNNHHILWNGEQLTIAQVSAITGIKHHLFYRWINRGLDIQLKCEQIKNEEASNGISA